jgi:superfamily II RNA helicase
MRALQELEYLDDNGTPTYDGRWAAQLRLDHPLLIAEFIRQGALQGLDADELAAVVAPFVLDKDREIVVSRELWQMTRRLWKKFRGMARQLRPLMEFMTSRGFDVPSIMFWPAAAVYLWADGVEWSLLVDHVDADEGDLAMLILRTADHVRQLIALENEQPELAETARRAVQLLMRPPVV